ncbi:pikachurin-like isoform X2 [Tachypleus tridentatus]|uniref:pikachurin-like isoform X2 n=1 Tax=Tachypleus tridentatus TaxID=6853 RepID=UPI003FD3125A
MATILLIKTYMYALCFLGATLAVGCTEEENPNLLFEAAFQESLDDRQSEEARKVNALNASHIQEIRLYTPKSLSRLPEGDERHKLDSVEIHFESIFGDGPEVGGQYYGVQDTDLSHHTTRSDSKELLESKHGNLVEPMNTVTITTPSSPHYKTCQQLECTSGGACIPDQSTGGVKCSCPLGRGGMFCEKAVELQFPQFIGSSYLVLPSLRDSHKSMQISIEFRPQHYDGIILYNGEYPDLRGDFAALTLNKGFVEFRFDCGMGMGVLQSQSVVLLDSWNYVTVYRDRWDAWLQLNKGKQVHGRSKGLFSRITFRQNLYLGGSPNISLVQGRTGCQQGFVGCVRHLEINTRKYDFRYGNRGDALEGVDVGECSADKCRKVTCLNGGQCVAAWPNNPICVCPLGYSGDLCERAVELVVPSFNGSSYLQYSSLDSSALTFIELLLVFKPEKPDGVLFYNGNQMDGTGDFVSISLVHGFVEFRFDLGTGPAVIRSPTSVEMSQWHTLFVSRTGRNGILEVDNQLRVEGTSQGAFTQLSLPLNLYLGGVPDLKEVAQLSGITASFTGCILQVIVNNKPVKLLEEALSGRNMDNCEHECVSKPCQNRGTCVPKIDSYTCNCLQGFAGTNCQQEVMEMIAQPMFSGNSYLFYLEEDIMRRVWGREFDINFQLRAYSSDGLVVWVGEKDMSLSTDYLALGLKNGYLQFQYNLGSGEVIIVHNRTRMDNGEWHSVRAVRFEREGSLVVDGEHMERGISPGPLKQLNVNNGFYLGGAKDIVHSTFNKFQRGLVGCLSNVTLEADYHIRLVTYATIGVNIQPCI